MEKAQHHISCHGMMGMMYIHLKNFGPMEGRANDYETFGQRGRA